MLGPGTSITHAAIKASRITAVSSSGAVRMESILRTGISETRKAWRVIKQAELVSDMGKRLVVISRMYHARFGYSLPENLSLEQSGEWKESASGTPMRKLQGIRNRLERKEIRPQQVGNSDPVNRACPQQTPASTASVTRHCSAGYPRSRFIHTGKQLPLCRHRRLYKVDVTVRLPSSVQAPSWLEGTVRQECRIALRNIAF